MEYKGRLYVVATPIGNLQDITLRAIKALNSVGAILCEDTRQAKKLLSKYEVEMTNLIPFNEFNENNVLFKALELLKNIDVALISDAGTPLISDPGYKLVVEAKKRGIRVVPIPGPSAILTALSASGLPTDKFSYLGFLPKSSARAAKILESYKSLQTTIVLYESPYRLLNTLKLINTIFGDIGVVLARELTKIHEEYVTGTVYSLIKRYASTTPKGEFVILFSNKS